MSLRERYEAELTRCGYARDAAQDSAIDALETLTTALTRPPEPRRRTGLVRRLRVARAEPGSVRGLYLWGGVGRGKTWLMDLFYECLPVENKMRSHFHRFMHAVHERLKNLRGQPDPLETAAEQIARDTRVICFDEFFVSDITDAMILGTLFDALFRRGVTLVATSNVPPVELYKGGLQRQRFLPAIALLEQHTRVLNVDGGVDYRLRLLERCEIYHCPLDARADTNLRQYFEDIAPERSAHTHSIEIEHREISTRERAEGVVWFEFEAICGGPRSANDYIEIAREYHTVLVSNVPQLSSEADDQTRRMISLVDEFYDRNVKLIVSAAVPLAELYAGKRLGFEFARTRSRLHEMQSRDYLARPHLP